MSTNAKYHKIACLNGRNADMKTNTIITIGRQFGSAGREIGNKIAKDLEIKLYDF